MGDLLKEIQKVAELQLMELDVSDKMVALKKQYGTEAVVRAVKASGFYVILKKYLS